MPRMRRTPYTYHTHPETGARCPASTPGAVQHRGRSKYYVGIYKDERGVEVSVKLTDDKATSRRMLAELQRQADLARAGLGDPFREHRRRPLVEHVADFVADVAARGGGPSHVRKLRSHLNAVLAQMRATLIEHLSASGVTAAIAALRVAGDTKPDIPEQTNFRPAELVAVLGIHRDTLSRVARRVGAVGRGLSKKRRYTRDDALRIRDALPGFGVTTSNLYLASCKQFTRWLVRDRRCATDPLLHLRKQNSAVDVRKRRRALTTAEFEAFVSAAAAGKPFRGITGPARLVLYVLAANTGLRAHELATLTPQSFDWAAPSVSVEAVISKRRRRDVQVLRPDVADMVRQYIGNRPGRLWPGAWWEKGAEMVQEDLRAAGIPYVVDGRAFDFHALRYIFASTLAAAGVHPRVAQELLRHSDTKLTMNVYTDARLLDVRGALDSLPPLPGAKKKGKKRPG